MEDRRNGLRVAREATLWLVTLAVLGAFLYAVANASPESRQAIGPQPAPVLAPALTHAARKPRVRAAHASAGRIVRVRFDRLPALEGVNPKSLGFQWPVAGWHEITSPFGPRPGGFHHGADIGCAIGQPLYASRAGRVIGVGDAGPGYGLTVFIDHGSGYQTLYGHLSRLEVQPGQIVRTRQEIGRCGDTGNATGPHVHFEMRYAGYVWDPLKFLP